MNRNRKVAMKKNKFFLTGLLVLTCTIPSSIVTYAGDVTESDQVVQTASKYIITNEDGSPEYLREQAIEDGVDEYVLEVADAEYQYILSRYIYETTGIEPRWPAYGNWCGPNYGSGTSIDILDAGCKAHDLCYRPVSQGGRGYHKCSCDRDLLNHINRNISKMSGSQKLAANALKVWVTEKLSNQTSTGGTGVASHKQIRRRFDIY